MARVGTMIGSAAFVILAAAGSLLQAGAASGATEVLVDGSSTVAAIIAGHAAG